MPYKTDKMNLGKENDNRRKLSDDDKELIKKFYGRISQRKLAKYFGVSRRTIIFIGDPEKHKRNLECRHERGGWRIYYSKKKNAEYQRTHRRRKHELLKDKT